MALEPQTLENDADALILKPKIQNYKMRLPMKQIFLFILLISTGTVFSQNKKPLDHADVHRWRKIEQQKLMKH